VAHADVFAGDHFGTRQSAFDLAGVDDGIALVHALDGAGHDGFAPLEEVVEDLFAFRVTDLLQNGLLGGLSANATDFLGFERLFDVFAHFDVGDQLARIAQEFLTVGFLQPGFVGHHQPAAKAFMLPGLPVDRYADVGVLLEALLHGGGKRALERTKHDFTFDILFTRQGVDQKKNFATHRFFPLKSKMGSSFARSTSSNVKSRTCSSPFWVSNSRPYAVEPAASACGALSTPVDR